MRLLGISGLMILIGIFAYYRYAYGGSYTRLGLVLIVEVMLAFELVRTLRSK
jgi:hypothetical protein